jgi:hypothetical protein
MLSMQRRSWGTGQNGSIATIPIAPASPLTALGLVHGRLASGTPGFGRRPSRDLLSSCRRKHLDGLGA